MVFFTFIFVLGTNYACSSSIGHRIIGGNVGYAGQYPFLAAITYHTRDGSYFCGGALLSQEWILTAGHCVQDAVLFTVHLGSHNRDINDPNLVLVSTENYVIHPEYDPLTLANDIGLIKLRMPIEYSTYIRQISLPHIPISEGGYYIAMGWGQISDSDAELQEHMNWVYVKALSNAACKLYYGNQIFDNMVCAEGNFNEGTCYGDTGGPLMHNENRVSILIDGVASFISQNGCENTDPSGYTRVYPYVSWITNVTGIIPENKIQ